MKRNSLALCLTAAIAFISCSKDKNENPEPMAPVKNITCTLDSFTYFSMSFVYDEGGNLAQVTPHSGYADIYMYGDQTIAVTSNNTTMYHTRYTLNKAGDRITRKESIQYNGNILSSTETSSFIYNGNYWIRTDWTDGTEEAVLQTFEWGNQSSVTKYEDGELNIMTVEYSSPIIRPENFPYRLMSWRAFDPVNAENFHPLNFLYGNMNTYLPEKITHYKKLDSETILAEYTFTYNIPAGSSYIHSMVITEEKTGKNYNYTFEY